MTSWIEDLRCARRVLWRRPLLTLAAILTLALGIGANTVIFETYVSQSLRLSDDRDPIEVPAVRVSPGLFELLGIEPVAGRLFTAADEQAGETRLVVLGHDLWLSRFGGDPETLGRTLLDGEPHTIANRSSAG